MAEKIFKSRIVHKHDTAANWSKATTFIPKQGEIIIYDDEGRMKVGDGKTLISALPFTDKAVRDLIDTKVDKVSGKGLSTNDYTTAEKSKLAGIAEGANKTVVDTALSASSTNPVQNKVVNTAINNLSNLVGDVAVSEQISDVFDDAITDLSVSGKTITYTKGDGTTGTLTTQDTTYNNATTSANGLMSAADKTKLNYTNVAYGTCSTAAATAAKVITLSGNTNWALTAGSMIVVKFSETNTAENPTFNVNGTGAKSVWYNTALLTTSSVSYAGYANRPMKFVYDGTQYVFMGWAYDSNSDTKVQQNAAITTAGEYPVILAYSTSTSKVTNAVNKASALTYNPSTKVLTATTFKGALDGNAKTATSATSATTAGSATKATQDADGNVITSTYATQTALKTVSDLVGDTAVSTQIANSLQNYYTKDQVDALELITVADIDAICGSVPDGDVPQSDINELLALLK